MLELAHEFNKKGETYYLRQDYDEALKHFKNAHNIDPSNIHAINNIGVALSKLGRYKEAEKYFKQAISKDPQYAEGFNNLANVNRLMGFQVTAARYLEIALQIKPNYEGALLNLGLVTEDIGNLQKSYECNEAAYKLSKQPEYLANMYYLKRRMCDWSGLDSLSKQLDKNLETKGETPFINLIRASDEEKNFNLAQSWSRSSDFQTTNIKNGWHKKHKKIRLAYISETFRDHPVGHCVYKIFRYHDKRSFDVYAYSYGINDGSIFRTEVEKNSKFFDIRKFDTKKAIQLIKSHEIEVLIDLQGLTKDNRVEILDAHPAKIQINYLGYPGTSGKSTYDYLIADRVIIPRPSQKYYSEKIIYLNRPYQINSILPVSKDKILRSDFNLPEKSIIFCSFARSAKIEEKIYKAWLDIISAVLSSFLWLYLDNAYAQKNLLSYAVKCGIDASRIIFSDRSSIDKHLNRLRLADIALDTSIYSGGATTANALFVNVPVLTLKGNHYLSRMSESLLKGIKANELIARDLSEYKKIAVRLAKDKKFYKKTKEKIRKNKNLIFNAREFTKDFEKLLKNLCENHKK